MDVIKRNNWVTTWENLPSDVLTMKTVSACASWQPDQSSLSSWRNFTSMTIQNASSEDSDQTAQMRRLIWIFAGCTCWKVHSLMLLLIWRIIWCMSEFNEHRFRVLSFHFIEHNKLLKFAKKQLSVKILRVKLAVRLKKQSVHKSYMSKWLRNPHKALKWQVPIIDNPFKCHYRKLTIWDHHRYDVKSIISILMNGHFYPNTNRFLSKSDSLC